MATPNYGYEKRQKELAKKRKKEDKLRAKADRRVDGPGEAPSMMDGESGQQPLPDGDSAPTAPDTGAA